MCVFALIPSPPSLDLRRLYQLVSQIPEELQSLRQGLEAQVLSKGRAAVETVLDRVSVSPWTRV